MNLTLLDQEKNDSTCLGEKTTQLNQGKFQKLNGILRVEKLKRETSQF